VGSKALYLFTSEGSFKRMFGVNLVSFGAQKLGNESVIMKSAHPRKLTSRLFTHHQSGRARTLDYFSRLCSGAGLAPCANLTKTGLSSVEDE
jgi:hypothetical protein